MSAIAVLSLIEEQFTILVLLINERVVVRLLLVLALVWAVVPLGSVHKTFGPLSCSPLSVSKSLLDFYRSSEH